ncbi:hypothetical protein RO3G_02220 [Rhizopus delemar RA 99-880]|uniref:Uncharacterized protein n=1 Tax=Rhizopus delemar (strain RA 99-880 / ATCC MYA-4621 / FGSC 9543 / NRRL 43880) TaxID=246409 RepID=I1BMT6_RHIO9|nr:hypothetical protein RO3G_02220 [Rhizopus delemar RA 99-880]|eukprot:EIE77516.1 hypothetical protein RO3G_02220 [Rhizopus delemar RA 99-880]
MTLLLMKHIALKKINVEEEDQVKLQGLDVSLMSYLKTYYVNRLHMFDEANNLTDESVHSQLSLLNEDQRTELKRIFRIELGRSDTYCDIIKEKIEGSYYECQHGRSWWGILSHSIAIINSEWIFAYFVDR